jgi:prepilin signal peptidase PulO-like enzyme (type II secretory pathway)
VWIIGVLFSVVSVLLWIYPMENLGYFLSLILCCYFGLVLIIDLEHQVILHPISWVGLFLCLGIGWMLHGLWITLAGGIAGYLILLGFFGLARWVGGWLPRICGEPMGNELLGYGDVNLAGILGLLLGYLEVLEGLFLSVFLAGIMSFIILLIRLIRGRYQVFTAIPLGPFLILGSWLILLFRDDILTIFS